MPEKYVLIVRDKIILCSPQSDEASKRLDCYYKSPAFVWEGSLASLDAAIDSLQEQFNHFLDWSAEVVTVQ